MLATYPTEIFDRLECDYDVRRERNVSEPNYIFGPTQVGVVELSVCQPRHLVERPFFRLMLQHKRYRLRYHLRVDVNKVLPLVETGLLEDASAVCSQPDTRFRLVPEKENTQS